MFNKIERGDRRAKREQVTKLKFSDNLPPQKSFLHSDVTLDVL